MGPNLNLLKFSLVVTEWINHRVMGNFFIKSKIAHDNVITRSKNRCFVLTCWKMSLHLSPILSQSSSEPSSFSTKMFPIKLSRLTFADQVYTCFGSLVGGKTLNLQKTVRKFQPFSNLKIGVWYSMFLKEFQKTN